MEHSSTLMLSKVIILFWIACFAQAAHHAKQNQTILVPSGSTNHGDPDLLCTPTSWTDVFVFFFGNYVAHAATVVSLPGESPIDRVLAVLCSLLFPSAGAVRAIDAICSRAIFGRTDLEIAARAGALFTVVKTENVRVEIKRRAEVLAPLLIDLLTSRLRISPQRVKLNTLFPPDLEDNCPKLAVTSSAAKTKTWMTWLGGRRLHGFAPYQEGYSFILVPADATFELLPKDTTGWHLIQPSLASNLNIVKALIALVQTVYAAATLYRARGNQIELFGYAAFGLTVTPYVYMSALNLIASLLCPEYSTTYLVESPDMIEARREHGYEYTNVVGTWLGGRATAVDKEQGTSTSTSTSTQQDRRDSGTSTAAATDPSPDNSQPPPRPHDSTLIRAYRPTSPPPPHAPRHPNSFLFTTTAAPKGARLRLALLCLSIGVPLAVVGGLTRFHGGSSSTVAQRAWPMGWLAFGITIGLLGPPADVLSGTRGSTLCSVMLVYAAPAVGGMIVVGQMLVGYGVCVRVGGGLSS